MAAYSIAQVGLDTGENPSCVWGMKRPGTTSTSCGFSLIWAVSFTARMSVVQQRPVHRSGLASWHSRFHDDRGVIGRVVQLNKHPFTIIGVAPPEFHGTLVFFTPDFFVPLVNEEQIEGWQASTAGERDGS